MHLDDAIHRVLTVLEADLPAALTAVEALLVPGTATTRLEQHGALAVPVDYRRGTDDLPELQYPAVLVEVEGTPDTERYVSDHKRRAYPLAVSVIGFERDTETLADLVAWSYAEAVERVLWRAAGGGVIHFVEVEPGTPEPYGDGGHGRSVVVRATVHQYAVPLAS